jgi:nucleoid DNA-binding protein
VHRPRRDREALLLRSFIVRDKGQRVGRNPKTGIEVPIDPDA